MFDFIFNPLHGVAGWKNMDTIYIMLNTIHYVLLLTIFTVLIIIVVGFKDQTNSFLEYSLFQTKTFITSWSKRWKKTPKKQKKQKNKTNKKTSKTLNWFHVLNMLKDFHHLKDMAFSHFSWPFFDSHKNNTHFSAFNCLWKVEGFD